MKSAKTKALKGKEAAKKTDNGYFTGERKVGQEVYLKEPKKIGNDMRNK